ncbi:MAG: hypothetical protein GEV07_04530 [Streptosporangiales bacterium]|nr:hypothetical protein [Streptosporangiales bacterium]
MARRGSTRAFLVVVPPLLVAGSLHAQNRTGWLVAFVILYLVAVVAIWVLLFMRTTCDMITKTDGSPCGNAVRGRLRACRYHKRQKRAVWLARIGFRRAAAQLGRRVARPTAAPAGGGRPATTDDGLSIDKSGTDGLAVVCTLISTVGTVVSATVGVIGLALQLL